MVFCYELAKSVVLVGSCSHRKAIYIPADNTESLIWFDFGKNRSTKSVLLAVHIFLVSLQSGPILWCWGIVRDPEPLLVLGEELGIFWKLQEEKIELSDSFDLPGGH